MEVKTDTKEKFHVISVETDHLSANMTAELSRQLSTYLQGDNKNIVLKLPRVKSMEEEAAESLVRMQQTFYEGGASFVICELSEDLEAYLDSSDLLELMNVTPTES